MPFCTHEQQETSLSGLNEPRDLSFKRFLIRRNICKPSTLRNLAYKVKLNTYTNQFFMMISIQFSGVPLKIVLTLILEL